MEFGWTYSRRRYQAGTAVPVPVEKGRRHRWNSERPFTSSNILSVCAPRAPQGPTKSGPTTFHRDHINDRAAETEKNATAKDRDRDPHSESVERGPPQTDSRKSRLLRVPTTDTHTLTHRFKMVLMLCKNHIAIMKGFFIGV
ncbi:hypothetical protein ABEB36_012625 [Hypothenemus hampei]|uniref:Uncharacterized protein n=1 Tax=Hypothenemus hampei TaxID=57062 RepID=A0ABD1EDY1_HYPHA